MHHSQILGPVVALVAWSLVMWVWMYATRIPAMQKAKLVLDPTIPPGELMSGLPANVRWKADNYNHLMEQPTIFYAIALTLAMIGQGDGLNATIAWAFVVLRVIHSLVQVTVNNIMVRFSIFVLSTLCVVALTLHAAMAIF
ncbi:MAPEG family protein [Sphingomonas sp. LaA6.9]|uniref:MAPEG family protein n=1 Tax=Sphingomonas sp. LaA6.9 TaxID=2919914 RepID=UPI001F4F65EA|nr:MAPEG family protein [Sphingomonas sp. LaA6.9]MCJ8157502.1 MAPEG family protein [Sphingomonas sp. LaA6.9]